MSIYVKAVPGGPLETNSYLIYSDKSEEAVLIDAPPMSLEPVVKALSETGKTLTSIFLTHGHFDHVLDTGRYINSFGKGNLKIYAHKFASDGLEYPDTMGFLQVPSGGFPPAKITDVLLGGETVKTAVTIIEVLYVPGHTSCSLAYYLPENALCFTGDLIFRRSIGRSDLGGGNPELLQKSIAEKIFMLDDQTVLYPGHGELTTVGEEKRYNQFINLNS